MKIVVQIIDDKDEVVAKHEADASTPSQWRSNTGFKAKMPAQSENENNGTYELFGFTFQPHLRVDRPNGWEDKNPGNGYSDRFSKPAPSLPPGFPKLTSVPRLGDPQIKNTQATSLKG